MAWLYFSLMINFSFILEDELFATALQSFEICRSVLIIFLQSFEICQSVLIIYEKNCLLQSHTSFIYSFFVDFNLSSCQFDMFSCRLWYSFILYWYLSNQKQIYNCQFIILSHIFVKNPKIVSFICS